VAERETTGAIHPIMNFNFDVEVSVEGVATRVCNAAFAECDGLDMTLEIKTIREGGNNGRQIRLAGPAAFGTLTLKRGMTSNFDLWAWFDAVVERPELRADVLVVVRGASPGDTRATFELSRCIPVKLKAPSLNARDGGVAIEELQLVYESLRLVRPAGGA
jgi:phage tail-like protein